MRINLLPHREQKRQARQRQFISLVITFALAGVAIVVLTHVFLASRIDNQLSRNQLLKTKIAELDAQIKEIDRLRDQIQQVLARKQVVESQQSTATRPCTCSTSSCGNCPRASTSTRSSRPTRR